MREILFRGKTYNDKWVQGLLVQMDDHLTQIRKLGSDGIGYYDYSIVPSTVGQYTGLTDKNGKKIFEGDIVKHESGATVLFHKVVFERRNGCAYFGAVMGEYETWGFCNSFPPTLVEIVGNIHDNPELLEVTE